MKRLRNDIKEMFVFTEKEFPNTDSLTFTKMKIDFTNDVEKVLISSDVENEPLKVSMVNGELETSSIITDRIIIRGIDVTDEVLELFLKNRLR